MSLQNGGQAVKIFSIILIVLTILANITYGSSIKSGGYSIVVAIEEAVVQPNNFEQYLQKIQHSLQIFSSELHKATNGGFHIRNVDLLLPSTWRNTKAQPATTQSYESSDIRLSNEDIAPYVENPNPCGLPGQYIKLSKNFFKILNGGSFGDIWKVLLTQWARFRWGVWEEHGYPGYVRFPYFYLGPKSDLWIENSCSNVKLKGKYEDLDGDSCNVEQVDRPTEDCRFKPDQINEASSSLMSYHWLKSITHFCDKGTHDKLSPNKQNLFCNHRSIWEVVRETTDFKNVNPDPNLDVKVIKFNKIQKLPTKHLYILLDRGSLDKTSSKIIVQAIPELGRFISKKLDDSVVVSIGEYPVAPITDVKDLSPWVHIGTPGTRDKLLEHIIQIPKTGPLEREFGAAIEKVSRKIQALHSSNGAAILVIKTGSFGSFDFITHEETIYTTLVKNKIKLFAAEITSLMDGTLGPASLERLAKRTGGAHVTINDVRDAGIKVSSLVDKVAADILIPVSPSATTEVLNLRDVVKHNDEFTLNVKGKSTIYVRLTVLKVMDAELIIEGRQNPMIEIENEWAMPSRHTQTFTHRFNENEKELKIKFKCRDPAKCVDKSGQLMITEKFNEPLESSRLKVTLTTSALENKLDFQTTPIAFAIYAKIELDGKPVEYAHVKATVRIQYNLREYKFPLLDNGLGNPDIQRLDGVYSSIFVPEFDAPHVISVHVTSTGFIPIPANQSSIQLLPPDQHDIIDCGSNGCDTVLLSEPVSVIEDVPGIVSFTNVNKYPGRLHPEKVLDFRAERSQVVVDSITFKFTSPNIIGKTQQKAVKYTVFGAMTQNELIGEDTVRHEVASFETVQIPGCEEQFSTILTDNNFVYFTVVAFAHNSPGPDLPSELSNIARIYFELESTTSPPDVTTDPVTSEDSTPFFETIVGIIIIVFIVIAGVSLIGGAGYWWYKNKRGGSRGSRSVQAPPSTTHFKDYLNNTQTGSTKLFVSLNYRLYRSETV